jgi:hypothetical protein
MNKKQNVVLAILLLLFLIFFTYVFFLTNEEEIPLNTDRTKITMDNFTLTTEYKGESKWEYTIVGQLPNPCYTVSTNAIVAESYPEQVSITVNVQPPDADVICAQVIQEYEYTGEFQASEKATVKLLVE